MKSVVIVYILILFVRVSSLTCGEEEFACKDGKRCISINYVCNDYTNCLDDSDEEPKLCEDWEYDYDFDNEEYEGKELFELLGLGDIGKQLGINKDPEEPKVKSEVAQEQFKVDNSRGKIVEDLEEDENPELCSMVRCDPRGVLSFVDDRQYKYEYNVEITTEASSDNKQRASVLIKSNVTLLGISACEFSIKVTGVKTFTSHPNSRGNPVKELDNENFEQQLMQNELRFSMDGGLVNFLCPKNDDIKVLNFKRGIISMLQNSMPALHLSHQVIEKDVTGECPTHYSFVDANEASTIISRSKDLYNCRDRTYLHSATNGVPYEFPGGMQSLPLINSTNSCQQQIKNGIIQSVDCIETHSLIPFTSESSSISTSISQKLELKEENFAIILIGKIHSRTDIVFDHRGSNQAAKEFNDENNNENSLEILKSYIINAMQNDNKRNHIGNIIRILKKFSVQDFETFQLDDLWGGVHRNILSEALGFVNTQASVGFMVKEMEHIEPTQQAKWLTSFGKIPSPDLPILKEVMKLFRYKALPAEIYLHVGAIINGYCVRHPGCGMESVIDLALKQIELTISNQCTVTTSEDKIKVMMALKGIGNAGIAVRGKTVESLSLCAANEEADMEIRTAAIAAFRRIPCSASRTQLKIIFANQGLDAELRIIAYMEIMRCPNYRVINDVRYILQVEEVNQVGSFVWTHLKNLQETGLPSKLLIQSLLSDRELEEKFNPDVRKFSRFIEWSAFYDEMNAGASLESSIIFSQKSYIPRVATVNLTADLFGKSFNFLEFGARIEGFDKYIEKMLISFYQPQSNRKNGIRNKEITDLINKNDRRAQYLDKEAELSVHMKTFGNEYYYRNYRGESELKTLSENLNPFKLYQDIIRGKKFSLQSSAMPISGVYYVATSAGLSLGVNIDAIASVDLSSEIELDFINLITTKSGTVKGKLEPTLDIDLQASMVIDAISSTTGIEFSGKLHSSASINGQAEIDGYKVLKFDISLPNEMIDIFDISARLTLVHESSDMSNESSRNTREIVGDTSNLEEIPPLCTSFQQEIGVEFCYIWSIPHSNEIFSQISLLNGPVRVMAAIKKKEKDLTSYKFRYQWEQTGDKLSFILLLDTPGTSVSREHVIKFVLDYVYKSALFLIKTPKTDVNVKGKYIWNPNEKRIDSTIRINDMSGSAIIGFKIASKSSHSTLLPSVIFVWDNKEVVRIGGSLESILRKNTGKGESKYYDVDLRYDIDINGKYDGNITGHVNVKSNEWKISLDIPYSIESYSSVPVKEQIHIEYTKIMKQTDSVNKYDRNWKITFTQFPSLNMKGRLASKKYFGMMENELQIGFGIGYERPTDQVTIYQNLIFIGESTQSTFNSTIAINYPKQDLDLKIGIDYFKDRKELNTGFIFQYASGNSVSSRLHLLTISSDPLNTQVEYHLRIPDLINFVFEYIIKEINRDVFQFDILVSFSESAHLQMDGLYSDHSTSFNSLHNLELKVKVPNTKLIYVNTTVLQNLNEIAFLGQLTITPGYPYTLRIAYITEKDDFLVLERRLEVDFQPPQRLYYWHVKYSIGEFITISNEIHLDVYRDIMFWIQSPLDTEKSRSIEVKFYWDANRDPHKKATAKIILTNRFFNYSGSLMFLENEYNTFWTASKLVSHTDIESNYEYKSEGFITWKDSKEQLHELSSGLSFQLQRGAEAELIYKGFLITPFNGWEDNWFKLEYARNHNRISSSLKSRWHDNEYINVKAHSSKFVLEDSWEIESILDINSSIEGLVNVRTEGSIHRTYGKIEAKGLIKWEEDILDFLLEGENNSGPDEVRLSLSAKTTTTLPGFALMKAKFDFMTAQGIVNAYSAIQWDSALYALKTRGLVFTKDEFLRAELRLTTPDHTSDTAVLFFRVFKTPTGMRDKVEIIVKWYDQKLSLMGELSSLPDDFEVKLVAETPFQVLKNGSLSVAHKRQETYKTEAKAKWNGKYSAGFLIDTYFNSLLDFLLTVELETPFSQFQIAKAEIKNLFQISSETLIRSRIFTQLNQKKFGIGCTLEQASEPHLRVGLELYTPSPDLEEVYFDFAYNSTIISKYFLLSMGHGMQQHINLQFQIKHTEQSLELDLETDVKVPILGEEYAKMSIDFGGKLFWMTSRDLRVNLLATTISRTFKLTTKGSMYPGGGGIITCELDFPYETLRKLEFSVDYLLSPYPSEGYIVAKILSHSKKNFEIVIKGNIRHLALTFMSPFPLIRDAKLQYEMVAYDIKRSKFKASGSLNGKELSMDSIVILNNENYITKVEGELNSLSYGSYKVSASGNEHGEKFINVIQLSRSNKTYDMKFIWEYNSVQDWNVDFEIYENPSEGFDIISGGVLLQDVTSKPLRISTRLETPEKTYKIDFSLVSKKLPYVSSFIWDFPGGAGKLKTEIIQLSNEKMSSVTVLETAIPHEPQKQFSLAFDLLDHSPMADINVDVYLGFTAAIGEDVNTIHLNGTMRQDTTNDISRLIELNLTWPNSEPIALSASASYGKSEGREVSTRLNMRLPNCSYGFNGKLNKENETLSSSSVIWWQKDGFDKDEIAFNGEFLIKKDHIKADIQLSVPFVKGKHTALLTYSKSSNGTNIRGDIVFMEKEIEMNIKYDQNEGYAAIISNSFWNGNPLTIKYNQSLSSERLIGTYSLKWPRYNNENMAYEILMVKAKLDHSFLKFGHNGTIYITTPLSKNNTLILNYGAEFPAPNDVILMIHVHFGFLKFGIEGSDTLTKTDMFIARKTEVKLFNEFWPIAAAYIYQTYFDNEKIKEKLFIYQLKDDSDKSQITFHKESNNEGRKIEIDANFGSREIQCTTGYIYTPKIKNAEVSLTWGKTQGIIGEFSLEDESQSNMEDRYNIGVRLGSLLKLIEVQGQYLKNTSGLHTSMNYDWNAYAEDNDLIEATFYLQNWNNDENLHYAWNIGINHETLDVPLLIEGEFQKHEELLFSVKFLLHYSESPAHDFHLDAYLTKQAATRNVTNLIIINHPASSLYLETRGNVGLAFPNLNLDQFFVYTNATNDTFSARVIGEANVLKKTINSIMDTTYHRLLFHFDPNDNKSEIILFRDYNQSIDLTAYIKSYSSLPMLVISLENLNPNITKDSSKRSTEEINNLWLKEKVFAEGDMIDQRELYFQIHHIQDVNFYAPTELAKYWAQDAHMLFKLNHSRLLSSQIRWNKETLRSLLGSYDIVDEGIRHSLINVMSDILKSTFDESSLRIGPIINDLRRTFSPFMEDIRNNSMTYRDSFVETFTSTKLTEKEQQYLESMKYIYDSTIEKILSLEIVQKLRSRIITARLQHQISAFMSKISDSFQYLMENELSTNDVRNYFNAILEKLAQYYDRAAKELSHALRTKLSDFQKQFHIWLQSKLHSVYHNYHPHIMKTFHMIESGVFDVLEKISKTTKSLQEAFKSISYLSYMQKVYTTFYLKYKRFLERSLKENLEILCDYLYSKFTSGIKSFTDKVFPFLKDWIANLDKAWKKLNKFENVRRAANFFIFIYNKTITLVDRLDVKDKVLTSTAFVISKGNRILSQTAIDAEIRNMKVKTHMKWLPGKGKIIFQQKLPFVWKSFNQTPAWSKLFEIPIVKKIKGVFTATDYSLLDYWYKHININFSPWEMLPPFPAKAYYIGDNNIVTFDGRHIRLEGDCEHLLAADLVYKQWAVAVKRSDFAPKTIRIFVYGKQIEIYDNYEVKINNRVVGLPRHLGYFTIWRTDGSIRLKSHLTGFHVSWNIVHDVLIVAVPGTSFWSSAGVMGTNNNEPMDDMMSPEGKLFTVGEEEQFQKSWNLSSGKCSKKISTVKPKPSDLCEELFLSKISPYKHCFHHVNPDPFYDVCLAEHLSKRENACSVSLAYRDSCKEHNVHLKLPTFCVKCSYLNETIGRMVFLSEGESITVRQQNNSIDVVLLVEMSSCNRRKLQGSAFSRFIKSFDEGLQREGFSSIRYSVVSFGESNSMDVSLVSVGSDLFMSTQKATSLMKQLKFGKQKSVRIPGSAFAAINFVSKLNFRPSTKPAILLFSCSSCEMSNKFDYSTMYHIIKSSNINLVIFKAGFFNITKPSMKKKIIGYDERRAYTLKDSKRLKPGKNAIQYQIIAPKDELGYCYPLAIETGGSIFSTEFMMKSKKKAENLGMVVGRTLGLVPKDTSLERCLCMSSDEITPLMRCDQWEHGDYTILEKYGLDLDKNLVPSKYKQKDELSLNFYAE